MIAAWLELFAAALLACGLCRPLGRAGLPFALLFTLGTFAAERAVEALLHVRVAFAVAPAGLLLMLLPRRPIELPRGADPFPPLWAKALLTIASAACAIAVVLFVEHSIHFPDGDWDAWGNWNMRARFLFRGTPGDALSRHLWHSDYPFLIPAAVAQAWSLVGSDTKVAPAAVAFLWAALGVLIAATTAARLRGATAGWLTAGLFAATPWSVILAWNQYADLPLASFGVAAVALVALGSDRRLAVLAGVAAGFGVFCKNEGALMLVALAAAIWIAQRSWKQVLAFGAGALPMVALLAVHKRLTQGQNDFAQGLDAAALRRPFDLERWAIIGDETRGLFVDVRHWGPMLLALPVAIALALRSKAPREGRAAGAFALLMALAFLAIYLMTPLPLRWHVNGSIDRLVGQLWPSILLWLVLSLAPRS